MRAHLFPLPTAVFTSSLLLNPRPSCFYFPRSIGSTVAAARSRWVSDEEPLSDGRFGFRLEDDDFGGENQRTWWSDCGDDDDDELGLDEDDAFWVFKVLN